MATARGSLISEEVILLIALFVLSPLICQAQNLRPVADAGSSRYAGPDPIVLNGTGSYDPDNSGTLTYAWRQISGPAAVITGADRATPTISGPTRKVDGVEVDTFIQMDEIQTCVFELLVSDEIMSSSDTVEVIIVPDFGQINLEQKNPPFDPNKPTVFYFGGGDCTNGSANDLPWGNIYWYEKANVINFPKGYHPDNGKNHTYYHIGDMIIVFLSSVAPVYYQPIQTIGWSTGEQPAMDAAIRINRAYKDCRYAINRVTRLDAPCRWINSGDVWRPGNLYIESVELLLGSTVDGEQCWFDSYAQVMGVDIARGILQVNLGSIGHAGVRNWYQSSLTIQQSNIFNHGVIGGAYWSVIGPGKNLQLIRGVDYRFRILGGTMHLDDEGEYPARLPEPVTLVGPLDGTFIDSDGAVFSCEESENAVGYQLLFGPDPYRVMDYDIISDTASPPAETITSSPFEPTWWTVKVYDQYGSTIHADPIRVNFQNLDPPVVQNITTGQRYASIRRAIDDARNGQEIVISPRVYQEKISFNGKNLRLRSIDPDDSTVVSETVITSEGDVVTFSGGEDANCVVSGLTITGGKRGIYCSNASPMITNCIIEGNAGADTGAGIHIQDTSSPTLINCTLARNSASVMGGGIQSMNSSPVLMNCTITGNSAAYFGGGIYFAGGNPTVTNCILWDDTPDEIFIFAGTPVITYSDIQGGYVGEGNIDADPLFADSDNGDYHLRSQASRWDTVTQGWIMDDVTSPCIDAGDPAILVISEPAPNGDRINMGAYGGTSEASKSP